MFLHLDAFDGPLDLLLHLIKTQEINVFNIPIVQITEQYLSFLKQVPELDFHEAGEYLVMASQLLEMKAKYLVPALQGRLNKDAQSIEQMDEDDPRRPLVEALLEYEAIRAASEVLHARYNVESDEFASGFTKRFQTDIEQLPHPIKGNSYDLLIAFSRAMLQFAQEKKIPKVTVKAQKITIQQKIRWIKAYLQKLEVCELTDVFFACESRYELIISLMAVLELCKVNHLNVEQLEIFGPVKLSKGANFDAPLPELEDDEEEDEDSATSPTSQPDSASESANA